MDAAGTRFAEVMRFARIDKGKSGSRRSLISMTSVKLKSTFCLALTPTSSGNKNESYLC